MLEMKVKEEFYNYLTKGTKRIEIRLNDEKRQSIKIGDKIRINNLNNPEDYFIGEVIGLLHYDNFTDLISDLDISLIADKKYTKEELLKVFDSIYTKEEQEKYGVVGIRLKY